MPEGEEEKKQSLRRMEEKMHNIDAEMTQLKAEKVSSEKPQDQKDSLECLCRMLAGMNNLNTRVKINLKTEKGNIVNQSVQEEDKNYSHKINTIVDFESVQHKAVGEKEKEKFRNHRDEDKEMMQRNMMHSMNDFENSSIQRPKFEENSDLFSSLLENDSSPPETDADVGEWD